MGKIPDISYWQGFVAFSEETKKETDYIIHRASCGTSKDQRFSENVAKICALGMPYGVYHYLMALSADRARYEAEVFYNSVVKSQPKYLPTVWFADIEEGNVIWADGKKLPMNPNLHAIAKAFYDRLRALTGPEAQIGFYGGESIYEPYGKLSDIGYSPLWFANYSRDPKAEHHLHQYTSKGSWNGRTRIDLSKLGPIGTLEMFTQPRNMEETAPVQQQDDPKATEDMEKTEKTESGELMALCVSGQTWNLREGDGVKYAQKAYMALGESLPFVALSANGWAAVRKDGKVLWVSGKAVNIIDKATGQKAGSVKTPQGGKKVRVTEPYSWNVRAGDGTQYEKMLVAYRGYEWKLAAVSGNGWLCVRLTDGRLGWITPKAAKVV